MLRRILSISLKEFIHLRNDWWMPAFMLFGGALELLLVGWATSRPITNLPLMVWDQSQSPASREIVIALENTGTFLLAESASDMATIKQALDRGDVSAALIIPPDFDEKMADPAGQPILPVILNNAESIPATAGYFQRR